MAVRIRNTQSSALPLPFPFRGVLGPGEGVVLLLTAAAVVEAIGERAAKLFEIDEVGDLAGDAFALGVYGGAGGAMNIKTVTGTERDWGTLGATFTLDLAVSQFHVAELGAPCTITLARAAAAPLGVGHFTFRVKGTATHAITWANIDFTGSGPDLSTADEWIISIYPDGEGVFKASALPF